MNTSTQNTSTQNTSTQNASTQNASTQGDSRQPAPLQITLYSKPNCHLCDELLADLAWLQRELSFTVISHNINDDPALKEKFQYLIPVLEIGGTLYNPPHDLLQTRQRIISAARDAAA